MTRTIWKFALIVTDVQDIRMPEGSDVLCMQMQGSAPFIWAAVDPGAPTENRRFRIFGTGHPLPDRPGEYVGTVQDAMDLVWHLFDAGVAP